MISQPSCLRFAFITLREAVFPESCDFRRQIAIVSRRSRDRGAHCLAILPPRTYQTNPIRVTECWIPEGRIPRLLALAHRCYDLVRDGVILNQSELAHYGQISTTRMSQIMWLDNLAPDIQEQILDLPRTIQGRDAILEREVRPIAKTLDWEQQRSKRLWRSCPVEP